MHALDGGSPSRQAPTIYDTSPQKFGAWRCRMLPVPPAVAHPASLAQVQYLPAISLVSRGLLPSPPNYPRGRAKTLAACLPDLLYAQRRLRGWPLAVNIRRHVMSAYGVAWPIAKPPIPLIGIL